MEKTTRGLIKYGLDIELIKLYIVITVSIWIYSIADEIFTIFSYQVSRIATFIVQVPSIMLFFAGLVGVIRFCLVDANNK